MSWGALNLPAALAAFRRHNPLVTVRLRQSLAGSAGHLEAIADGRMDLALVSITEPPSPRIALRELTREPLVFVCAPSHPLANRAQVDIADLIAEELIGFPTGWGIRRSVDTAFATVGAQPRPTYEVADYAIAAEFIRHRLATAALPLSAAGRFPDLRAIALNPPLTWTLSIASASPQYISRAASVLADALVDHVADQ